MSIMLFWLLYEWNLNVSVAHPALEVSITYINRSNILEHSNTANYFTKLFTLLCFFKSNLGTYGHDFLAYERDAGGANLHPVVNLLPGANLHLGANCAHEHGFSLFLF